MIRRRILLDKKTHVDISISFIFIIENSWSVSLPQKIIEYWAIFLILIRQIILSFKKTRRFYTYFLSEKIGGVIFLYIYKFFHNVSFL